MISATEERVFSVGSFWKTNPPEGCFEGGYDGFETEFRAISEACALMGRRYSVGYRAGSGDLRTTRVTERGTTEEAGFRKFLDRRMA